jgi:hypothetical protein
MTLALLRTTGWLPYWNITDVPVPLAVCVNVPVEVAQLAGICTICGYMAAEDVLDGFGVMGMAAEEAVVVAIEMALMGEEEVATVEERNGVEQATVEGDVLDDEGAHCTLANMAVVVLLLLGLDPMTLGTNWMAVALDDEEDGK